MKKLFILTTILTGMSVPAIGADLGEVPGYHHTTPVEFGSGWYLRGDIGYSAIVDTNLSYYSDSRYDYDHQSIDHALAVSGGIGYHFNEFLRTDLTVEHSGGHDWNGDTYGTLCGGGATPGECWSEDQAIVDRTSLLLNGYFSLGQYGHFKPYVGAGIGVSHVSWDSYRSDAYCEVDPGETCSYGAHPGGVDPVVFDGPTTYYDGAESTVLTYALMAGFDYRIDHNWTVDFGYKWTRLDGGVVIHEDSNGAGSPQGDSLFDHLDTHEFKVGLRYDIW